MPGDRAGHAHADPDSDHGAHSAPSSGGRHFYVSAAGDDAASGRSQDESWRSLERVNREIFQPGDQLLFEAGSSFAGTLRLQIDGGGRQREPVRVSSFRAGEAPIQHDHGGDDTDAGSSGAADDRATIAAGAGDGIVIEDLSGVIVEKLRIVGGWLSDEQTGNAGEGVSIVATRSKQAPAYLRLRHLDVSGFRLAGIGLHARPADDSKDSGYRDVELAHSTIHDNGDFGVLSDGPYSYDGPGYSHFRVRVRDVVAHHNRGLLGKGAHTGSGIVLSDVDDAVIERCVAHDNGELNDHDGGGGFGIWAWDSNQVLIQYNESYDNRTRTADGGGFDLDGGVTRSVMRYNYSHGNQGAGYGAFQFAYARPYGDNRIYANISQDDNPGFLVWDGNGDLGRLDILQNVAYGAKPALLTLSTVPTVAFLNNIFSNVGPTLVDVYDGADLTLQGNVYWSDGQPLQLNWGSGTPEPVTFDSFEAFQAATHQETYEGVATGSYQDPQLKAAGQAPTLNDPDALRTLTMYQLQADSPVIDHGVDPGRFAVEPTRRDFFGDPAPAGEGFDPGVYERP